MFTYERLIPCSVILVAILVRHTIVQVGAHILVAHGVRLNYVVVLGVLAQVQPRRRLFCPRNRQLWFDFLYWDPFGLVVFFHFGPEVPRFIIFNIFLFRVSIRLL
jgi:hypothetical protein